MIRKKHVYRPKRVFAVALELAQKVERESRKRALFRDLFLERPCPSFQALHWCMKKKLGEDELRRLLALLKERLRPSLRSNELLILDSTGIPHRGKTQELGWMQGNKEAWPGTLASLVRSSSLLTNALC